MAPLLTVPYILNTRKHSCPLFCCCRIHTVPCEYSKIFHCAIQFEYSQGTLWILQQLNEGTGMLLSITSIIATWREEDLRPTPKPLSSLLTAHSVNSFSFQFQCNGVPGPRGTKWETNSRRPSEESGRPRSNKNQQLQRGL